jgi:hypothetical protein
MTDDRRLLQKTRNEFILWVSWKVGNIIAEQAGRLFDEQTEVLDEEGGTTQLSMVSATSKVAEGAGLRLALGFVEMDEAADEDDEG